jgi:hypothetical protein
MDGTAGFLIALFISSLAFAQCETCPVEPSKQDVRAVFKEAQQLQAGQETWARPSGSDLSFAEYSAHEKRLATMYSVDAAAIVRQKGWECSDITKKRALDALVQEAQKNPFLAQRRSQAQFSADTDRGVNGVLLMTVPLEKFQEAQSRHWACALADEEVVQRYMSTYLETGYYNYLMYRAHLRTNQRSDPMQAAFNKLGINKCDKWAADKIEWADAKVDMSPALINDGAARKFWGTVTAGNGSELIVHYAGGGAFGALMDRVGVTASSGSFANIVVKITPNTFIASRNIRVGGGLVGYGKQISIRDISLADKSRSTAAIMEAVCVEGF